MAAATGNVRTLSLLWAQCSGANASSECDVRLRTGIFAHSFVLASSSPVMAEAIKKQTSPSAIDKASQPVLTAAIALMYGVTQLSALEAQELLQLADLCRALKLQDALPIVDLALAGAIDANSALSVSRSLPRDGKLPLSAARLKKVLHYDIKRVAGTAEWSALPPDDVASALRVHDLAPNAEEAVFRAVEAWVAAGDSTRLQHAVPLLRWVRFPTMSDRALLKVARSPYFADQPEFYQLLLEAFIRRTDVRLEQVTRNVDKLWKRVGVNDTSMGVIKSNEDANARSNRTVLFQGLFPLRWYRNMRFRTRSACSMLFTFAVARWSTRKKRVRSESRAFGDRRWSIWVDPYAAAAAGESSPTQGDNDYISLFLCCEAETEGDVPPMRVDYSLFLAHAEEGYGMQRKVCVGRSFTFSGQAMGFRRHTKRIRAGEEGYIDSARDELIVGAQIIIPGAPDAGVNRPELESSPPRAAAGALAHTQGDSSPDSWPPAISTQHNILRDLPQGTRVHPAYARTLGEPLLRGASAVSDAAAAEVVRNLNVFPASP